MIPWAQLTEAERAKDRNMIWRLPEVLQAAGLSVQPLYSVALKRGEEANAETLVAVVRRRMASHPGATPHLILAVEDVRSFRLAKQLSEIADIAVSLCRCAAFAGVSPLPPALRSRPPPRWQTPGIRTVWLTNPDTVDEVLKRWPVLEGAGAVKQLLAAIGLWVLVSGNAAALSRSPLPDNAERQLLYPAGTRVLVIGMSAYRDRSWPALNGRRDAERVQTMFLERGVPASAITLALPVPGSKPSLEEIIVRFGEDLAATASPDTRVVVYIAGHGYTADGIGLLGSSRRP